MWKKNCLLFQSVETIQLCHRRQCKWHHQLRRTLVLFVLYAAKHGLR